MSERITRRKFATRAGATTAGILAAGAARWPADAAHAAHAEEKQEPKSIHTWLDSDAGEIYSYDIDVRITDFPDDPPRSWLYYFSLQVNFTEQNEWSHGGLQWSGTREFRENGNKGVNWGGGGKWAGYGGLGVNNTPFTWKLGTWYRFRVWRVDQVADDPDRAIHRWLFAVKDYDSGKELPYGTIRSRSPWIRNAVVFTETGYGVQCESPRARVEWRNPQLRTARSNEPVVPSRGTANYNGTCQGPANTNQGLLSPSPPRWFHATNMPRQVEKNARLWDRSARAKDQ